jgi:hypothetical protein
MALEFSQVSNEMAITIAQSLDLDDYESEYGEIVKNYADWINEMVRLYVKDKYNLNLL